MIRPYLDILAEVIAEHGNDLALTDYALLEGGEGNEYTYAQLQEQMDELKARFREVGLQAGDHIAICGGNCANWVVAYLAIAQFGAVSVPIMDSLEQEEQDKLIVFADCRAVVRVRPCEAPSPTLTAQAHVCAFPVPGANLAQICFTSGSSQEPKAVMLSMENISNNVTNIIDGLPNSTNRVFLSLLPLTHIYGLMTEVVGQLAKTKHVYLIGIVSPLRLFTALEKLRPYAMSLVPSIITNLFRYQQQSIVDLLQLSCEQLYIGGATLSPQMEEALEGLPYSKGYGMTETGPLISNSLLKDYKPHSVGRVVENMEAKIVNDEIWVRGANVMLGYYKDEEATREKIDTEGWLHTGDAGYIDEDGYLYVKGRINQDMIVLPSGENVSPIRIEAIINAQPGVAESLVLAREGHLVALVYPSPQPSDLSPVDLLRAINPQLPLYSQLYSVEFVSEPFAKTPKQTIKRYLYR